MTDLDDLERRAATDGKAAMALAEARLLGDGGVPDRRAALALVEQSARLGEPDGRRAWVYMTAAGIGREADPKAARAMLAELAGRGPVRGGPAGVPRSSHLSAAAGRGRARDPVATIRASPSTAASSAPPNAAI